MSIACSIRLLQLRDLTQDNVNSFVGLCVDWRKPLSVWRYAHKGSLEVTHNGDFFTRNTCSLHRMCFSMITSSLTGHSSWSSSRTLLRYVYALGTDITSTSHTQGMEYLHDSPVKTHGRLTSSNCVIDARWTTKITDYGPHKMRQRLKHDKGTKSN